MERIDIVGKGRCHPRFYCNMSLSCELFKDNVILLKCHSVDVVSMCLLKKFTAYGSKLKNSDGPKPFFKLLSQHWHVRASAPYLYMSRFAFSMGSKSNNMRSVRSYITLWKTEVIKTLIISNPRTVLIVYGLHGVNGCWKTHYAIIIDGDISRPV